MRTCYLFFISLFLFGCASVPLSTMLKYRNFDEQSFAALDPVQIRSKIRLSEPFTLKIEDINLSLTLENEKRIRDFSFPLELEKQDQIAAQASFFSSEAAQTEYTFSLSERAVKTFRETQILLSQKAQRKMTFSISAGLNEENKKEQSGYISIALQLKKEDGYFVLIDDTEIGFGQDD